MDIRQLQFLCALAEHGHFGAAADACHVTQPTLSMRIKGLEEELGIALINRNQRYEGLTPEGERLLAWAQQVTGAFQGLKTEAQRLKGALVGTLRIGMVPLSHVSTMPLLQSFREHAPQVRFLLSALSSEQILAQLDANEIDLGLTYLTELEQSRYQVLPLGSPEIGLLHNPAIFQFAERSIAWKQVAELPLGLLSNSMRFRQAIDYAAAAEGAMLQPIIESDAVEHLIEAVNSGICCTLVPLPDHDFPVLEALRMLPLKNPPKTATLALVCRSERSDQLTDAFMQHAKNRLLGSF